MKVTIVSGTDRLNSNTERVSRCCSELVEKLGHEADLVLLRDIPFNVPLQDQYDQNVSPEMDRFSTMAFSGKKLVFVIPEYHGSYPGILKYLLDILPSSLLNGKNALLIGIADGRQGNLRGLDHLSAVLNHLQVQVHFRKPKLSLVNSLIDSKGDVADRETLTSISSALEEFIELK